MSIFRMRYQSGMASRIGKIHLSNWTNRISIESLIGILIGESQNGFVISIQLLLMDFGLCFLMLALKLLVASCYFASCECQKETESNILKSWLQQRMYGIGGRTLEHTKWNTPFSWERHKQIKWITQPMQYLLCLFLKFQAFDTEHTHNTRT